MLRKQLTADRINKVEGYVATTLANMSDEDARRVAENIVSFAGLCQAPWEDAILHGKGTNVPVGTIPRPKQ